MADPNPRSLSACLRCRRLKVKCAGPGSIPCQRCKSGGAECQFVQPRAITRVASGLDAPIAVPLDQSEHFYRLESQIAQLTGVVEDLRSDLTNWTGHHRTGSAQKEKHVPDSNRVQIDCSSCIDAAWSSNSSSHNLVTKGIISKEQCVELFQTFLLHCNATVAIFDDVTASLDVVQEDPILLAAVCAIGARASLDKLELHQKCLAEAMSMISSAALGPLPSLMALRGIMLTAAWHRSDRLWGMVLTLAYEMGLNLDALRLSEHSQAMSETEIERSRTWLSIFCFELMAKTHRPYLIQDSERYIELAQDLTLSPYSRPVDQRIMAYLQLFKIVVEAKKTSFNELSAPEQEAQLIALNGALDAWFHRVHNSIDPLYQTFSEPQDRNRLVIPYAFVRLYINKLVLDDGPFNDGPRNAEDFATQAILAAVEAAFLLLSTAFESKALAQSLRYTIDYSSMTLTAALSFLNGIVITRPTIGIRIDEPAVVGVFARAREVFEAAGAASYVEWVSGLMEKA